MAQRPRAVARALGASWLVLVGLVGCADEGSAPATTQGPRPQLTAAPATTAAAPDTVESLVAATAETTGSDAETTAASSTTVAPLPIMPAYVFPFVGREVSYGTTHHDYPAVDVFGCGAIVVAPTSGAVLEVSTVDRWDPVVDDPATRGGLFVSMLGDDGVRYYLAHLGEVLVAPADPVAPGTPLGVMGATGNARNSECHTHLGISWACPESEWQVRRGEIGPAPYLDAWRADEQRSPAPEVAARAAELPTACADAISLVADDN